MNVNYKYIGVDYEGLFYRMYESFGVESRVTFQDAHGEYPTKWFDLPDKVRGCFIESEKAIGGYYVHQ